MRIVLVALLVAGCAVQPVPPEPMASTADALLARLPDNVAGFRRGGTTALTEPAPGSEVAYATTNRATAGYVQVLQRSEPMTTELLAPELRRLVAETSTGTGRRLHERGQAALGDFRCTELEGTYGRQAVEGLACVGAFGGQLVRLRLSMSRRGERMAEARGFAEGVAAVLR